ncbi:MAG: hypothetical protein ACLRI8_12320 [Agathobacter rectalis]
MMCFSICLIHTDTKRLRSDTKNLDQYFAQLAVLLPCRAAHVYITALNCHAGQL